MNLLTNEQISYLKSLDSKKKRRKFFLDCLVENSIGEPKVFKPIVFKNGVFKTSDPKIIEWLNNFESKTSDSPIHPFFTESKEEDGCIKVSGLPSTQFNEHVKVFHTNTTAPRTFENRQEFSTEDYDFEKGFKESIEMRIPNDSNAIPTEILTKLRGLFLGKWGIAISHNDAKQIDEILLKNNGFNNSKPEAKYTEEDMNKCFYDSRTYNHFSQTESEPVFRDFDDYKKHIEND